ncbi:right-handed parallel beta-helix repeat-containing protein [Luteolibacter arcticus]|uniref:Right-handed parallel beta-helix repeat-containing protein n=1 Tax=Luteolibacter arcticus TaxID=1581411 RepID=A0ABT3GDH0_9BACT|nr:right-handed parallel beta-helix repeat-containing protein [Luteolibacter arcticus]MCW1921350.1 right-handed parallel beta-helix repeat-containing protein [Luteolibacter arcticus]
MIHSLRPLLALSVAISWSATAAETTISVATHGASPDSGQDATVAFRQAIAAAKAVGGPVTLAIPPGRYDFDLASSTVRDCHTSNSTESGSPQRHIALDFTDIDDLTLDGPGATLMMRGQMTMLVAERCQGFTVRGVEFDFERPTFSEITAVEKGTSHWIGAVHSDSDYQIVGGNSLRWIGPGMDTGYDQIQRYDPATRTVTRNNNDPIGAPTAVTELGGGRLRFDGGNLGNVVPGITYQFRRARRNEVGMWFNRCSDVVMEDVSVRAMHGFGILAQFTENVTYSRLTIAPKPGSGRTCSSPADVLHFSGCKGTVRILDSTLSAAHDDALNVHGTHLRVVAQDAPNQLRLRFMHHQSWGFEAFVPGDQIELLRRATLLPYESATVTAVQKTSDYEQVITLDKDVTGVTLNSDAVENVTWTPAVEMINCDIAQIPTRGILLTTRRPILIQGNRFFRTQMHAILIEDDAAGWYESGPVHDLTVRGNSFYECAERVIHINPENTTHGGPVHKNITVEGNVFTLSGNGAADAKSTDDLVFSGNLFRMRNGTTPAASSLVSTSNTTNLSITGNTVVNATTPALAVTDGGFEQNPTSPWFGTPAGAVRFIDGGGATGKLAEIDAGAAIYQNLGSYDPAQGTHLRWAFEQSAISGGGGAVRVSFHAWDGRFAGAAGSDIASLPAFDSRTLPAWTGTARQRSGYVDLSGLPAGTQVWMRLASENAVVHLDTASVTVGLPPDPSHYGGWATIAGLTGSEADPEADLDHDHLPNLIEYLLEDTDPLRADAAALQALLKEEDGLPIYRYHPRAVADAVLVVEYQKDSLGTDGWQPVQDGVDGLVLHEEADGSKWVEVVETLADKLFIRLRAALLPSPPPLVPNASFESPDRTGQSPAYSNGNPDGWTFSSGVNWGVEEIRDNRFGTSGAEGSRLTALGGHGDQVAYINIGNSGGATATSAAVGTIAPDTTYTLRIIFAQRATGDRQPDGSFGLTANGIPVGTFTSFTSVSLPTGFTEKTYVWTSPAIGDPLIGQPLQIRMNFSHSPAAGWQQAQFDKVQLTTE